MKFTIPLIMIDKALKLNDAWKIQDFNTQFLEDNLKITGMRNVFIVSQICIGKFMNRS